MSQERDLKTLRFAAIEQLAITTYQQQESNPSAPVLATWASLDPEGRTAWRAIAVSLLGEAQTNERATMRTIRRANEQVEKEVEKEVERNRS